MGGAGGYWSLVGPVEVEEDQAARGSRWIYSRWSHNNVVVAMLTILLTVLNAFKPWQLDDNAYYAQARRIAQNPLDPYGFIFREGSGSKRGFDMVLPPVLPYWLAPAARIFGEQVFLIKLALLPVSLLLIIALRSLLRRFTPGLVGSLLWMTALGPVILPLFNIMLDVPETALALGALALFVRAHALHRPDHALLAGVAAALAVETKYTGLLLPAVFLAYAATHREWGYCVLATTVMVTVFA